jgi:hypothetical protein
VNPVGFLPSAASVGSPDPKPAEVVVAAGAPNDGLAKENEGVVFGGSDADAVAGCPKEKPIAAGLGSSLGAVGVGAAPNVNGVDTLVLFPNILPVAGADDVAAALELPKANPVDAGLSLFAVAPNPPKLGAAVLAALLFPKTPLVGAAFELPKDPELVFPNIPPFVPFVGAEEAGAMLAKGFGFGCSCCCPN